ncbi:MAG: ATP synthase subunit b [Candidatus Magasanikbacteria bacterium GW2011_GWC2_37_14]|uniref:ATP synthase subunit b n=1 Tax=Candidatus Magasanikbacteria bacterium GW2011_GWC2_37_14 TaxID=1619046 RepID=A0A0G0GDP0_9BACT|nr:MAG: ATP synthase subunit b [Candidatus Magasanikbacteria bacterium GW2011_GWC2_37_14]
MNIIEIANASTEETVVEHTTTPNNESVAASLGLNGQLFVFQLINFAIVAGIVWFLILKPLTSKLEERKNIIDESLEKAKEVEANLIMSNEKFTEKISEAKAEGNKIITKATTDAEELAVSMKAKAKVEIENLVEQARGKIKDEKEEVMQGIKKETASLIMAVVEKVLNEKLTDKKDQQLIEESLKNLHK